MAKLIDSVVRLDDETGGLAPAPSRVRRLQAKTAGATVQAGATTAGEGFSSRGEAAGPVGAKLSMKRVVTGAENGEAVIVRK